MTHSFAIEKIVEVDSGNTAPAEAERCAEEEDSENVQERVGPEAPTERVAEVAPPGIAPTGTELCAEGRETISEGLGEAATEKVAEFAPGGMAATEAELCAEQKGSENVREGLRKEAAERFEQANWPFFLAAAWVVFRDRDQAIEAWIEHRLSGQHAPAERFVDEVRVLVVQLRKGTLIASGIKPGQQQRTEISSLEWEDLTWKRWGFANLLTFRNNRKPNYVDIMVPARTVLTRWKPRGKERNAVSSSAVEKRCRAKLVDIMRQSPLTPIPKAELKKEFPIPDRGFDRAFSEAAKESGCPAWSAAGRRKPRSN
jgi:hypothetical protein